MDLKGDTFHRVDSIITQKIEKKGLFFLRISIGIVFLWFGMLKYFEGLSPAEGLALKTIDMLTFQLIPDKAIIYGLATWEVLIGLGLLLNYFMRETLLLLYLQMVGTFTPVFLFPEEVFFIFPFGLTLEGQYIIKNIIIVSAGIVLGATVRGGGYIAIDKDNPNRKGDQQPTSNHARSNLIHKTQCN